MEQAFVETKDTIEQWINSIEISARNVATNIILNTSDVLRVIFEGADNMAELIVEKGYNTPYRFVKFEILSFSSRQNPVYVWYDSQNDTIRSIIDNLQTAFGLLK